MEFHATRRLQIVQWSLNSLPHSFIYQILHYTNNTIRILLAVSSLSPYPINLSNTHNSFHIFHTPSVQKTDINNDPACFSYSFHDKISQFSGPLNETPNPLNHVQTSGSQQPIISQADIETGITVGASSNVAHLSNFLPPINIAAQGYATHTRSSPTHPTTDSPTAMTTGDNPIMSPTTIPVKKKWKTATVSVNVYADPFVSHRPKNKGKQQMIVPPQQTP